MIKEYHPTFFEEQPNPNLASNQPEQRVGNLITLGKEPEFATQKLEKLTSAEMHPARVVVISSNLVLKI